MKEISEHSCKSGAAFEHTNYEQTIELEKSSNQSGNKSKTITIY